MGKLSTKQQNIVDILKSDKEVFVKESPYYSYNDLIKGNRWYNHISMTRATLESLIKKGYLVKHKDYSKDSKWWVLADLD